MTAPGGPDFIRRERIAAFDNDGTLSTEQPIYFRMAFAEDRIRAMVPQHPEWNTTQPFTALLHGDTHGAQSAGDKGFSEIMNATPAGMTTDEFASECGTGSQPRVTRASTGLTRNSCIGRCWNSSPICERTALRPSS